MRLSYGLLRRSSLPALPVSDSTALAETLTTSSRVALAQIEKSLSNPAETQPQRVPYSESMILCIENDESTKARVLERVEVIVTYKQGRRVLKIVCLAEEEDECDVLSVGSVNSTDSFLSDPSGSNQSQPTSFLEELARTMLDPCQCQTFLKPALRKEKGPDLVASRSVSFDKVDIKEFPMTLGDHPSAASGPPVALDWEKVERERVIDLNEYEASRSPRRSRKQLKLSLRDRKGILQRQFSADEVDKAWKEARAIREQRRETIQRGMMMMLMDDMVETTNRKINRMGESFSSMILW